MTTILDYLCPDGRFSQARADEMCLTAKNYAKTEFELDKEAARALYRFAILTFNYLDKECNREDFNFTSFFKLLYCEILDQNFHKENETVYDVLIGDAKDHGHDIIYMMSNYWYEIYEQMPANADEMYLHGFGKFCDKNEIEFDENAMREAKAYHLNKEETEKNEADTDTAFDVGTLLQFFKDFAEFRQTGDMKRHSDAEDAIETFMVNNDADREIYDHCVQLLNEYKAYGPVLTAVKKNFVARF